MTTHFSFHWEHEKSFVGSRDTTGAVQQGTVTRQHGGQAARRDSTQRLCCARRPSGLLALCSFRGHQFRFISKLLLAVESCCCTIALLAATGWERWVGQRDELYSGWVGGWRTRGYQDENSDKVEGKRKGSNPRVRLFVERLSFTVDCCGGGGGTGSWLWF